MRMRKKKNGEQRLLRVNGLLVPGLADYATIRSSFRRPDAPLFLEIGCGKGDFICEMARRNPENAYLAVERVGDVLVLAAEKYLSGNGLGEKTDQGAWKMTDGREIPLGEEIPLRDEEKGNVRFTCCDGRGLLERMPDDVLSGIYLNFSDPWPKKGNAKRRLTHPDFLRLYQRVLVPGGKVEFKTDNRDLFLFSLESFESSGLSVESVCEDVHHSPFAEENIETEYERNFSSKGFPIHRIVAVKPLNSSENS